MLKCELTVKIFILKIFLIEEIKSMLKLKADIFSSQSRKRFLLEDISLLRYSFQKRFLPFEIHDKQLNIFNIIMDTKSMSEGIYSFISVI